MSTKIHFSIFLIITLTLGCKKKDTDFYKIGFSQAMSDDKWRKSMNDDIKDAALLDPKIKLIYSDAENNIENQIQQIETFIKDSVDLIILSPIKTKALSPVVEKAISNNIPVIVIDRKTTFENYTSYIGTDNILVGELAAQIIIGKIKNIRRSNIDNNIKTLNILEITGQTGSSPADERSIGFRNMFERFEKYKYGKKINLLKPINGDWNAKSIINPLKDLLSSGQNIDYIFVHNDRMAYTAWQIARNYKNQNNIKFIGVDGLNSEDGGIDLVKRGVLEASILYPSGGREAIIVANKILNNKPFQKNNFLETTVINSFNVNLIKSQINKIYQQNKKIKNQYLILSKQNENFDRQKTLIITIIMFSLIVLFYSIYSFYLLKKIRNKNKDLKIKNVEIEEKNNKIKKVSDDLRTNLKSQYDFFMNISHEFKTPLSLILNLIESLKDRVKGNTESEISMLSKNSYKLYRLVTQLLDFRKIGYKIDEVKVSKTNVCNFLEKILHDFKYEMDQKKINFSFFKHDEDCYAFFNHDFVDKVFYNLINNAIKFTPVNGNIEINVKKIKSNLYTDPEEILVSIHDDGIGIPENEIKNAFKPFFKGSNNKNISSGIGLYLAKQFLKLNHGSIQYSKNKNGIGSIFSVRLETNKNKFKSKNIVEFQDKMISNTFNIIGHQYSEQSEELENNFSLISDEQLSILIVEDDIDLALYLKIQLKSFDVFISDGINCLDKAFDIIPDLIICDKNLPGNKNGLKICEILKSDLRTSHIPFILLSADNKNESMIEGIKKGADIYFTKPFRFSVLNESINTLIDNRNKLKYYYTQNIENLNSKSFKKLEQTFFIKMNQIIDDNLSNSNFTVESLANSIGMSRVQLYRKVKSILNINISNYIIDYKLKKAEELLKISSENVSQIAYTLGFNSPNYFSTVFKNKNLYTPLQYRKKFQKKYFEIN